MFFPSRSVPTMQNSGLAAGSVLGFVSQTHPWYPRAVCSITANPGKAFPGIWERDLCSELPPGSCSADSEPSPPEVMLQIKLMALIIPPLPPGCWWIVTALCFGGLSSFQPHSQLGFPGLLVPGLACQAWLQTRKCAQTAGAEGVCDKTQTIPHFHGITGTQNSSAWKGP